MKQTPQVAAAFLEQAELAPFLIAELKGLFESRDNKWFFDVRSKREESFALKTESGRVTRLGSLEDFVACMLVVPLPADIPMAISFVERFFEIAYRRPPHDDETTKKSSDFPFDDLRLYGNLRAPQELPPRPIDGVTFEIQIKTFLQHAWSIATHDLVYKYGRVSWARNRVAHQIKALLEHAELSVAAMDDLERSGLLPAVGQPESEQQAVAECIQSEWPDDELPEDVRRLAINVWTLLKNCDVAVAELPALLADGRTRFEGYHPRTLAPFQSVLLYLAIWHADKLRALLDGSASLNREYHISVSGEVLEALGLDRVDAKRAL